jgi:hypothetical protein
MSAVTNAAYETPQTESLMYASHPMQHLHRCGRCSVEVVCVRPECRHPSLYEAQCAAYCGALRRKRAIIDFADLAEMAAADEEI